VLPPGHQHLPVTLSASGLALSRSGRPRDGEPLIRDALAIRRKTLAAGDWRISLTESALGECLAAQRRFAEAEPLTSLGVKRIMTSPGAARIRLRQAIERAISLYDASRKAAESIAWRVKLLDLQFPADRFNPPP
jgi:hypothetical protein